MTGSTIEEGTDTKPIVAMPKVMVWASVKVVTWSKRGFHFRERKKNAQHEKNVI